MTLHKPRKQVIIKEERIILTTLEEKKEYVQKFNVFDDSFFEMVAKDKDAVEDILRIILHDPELVITKLVPQNSIKNLNDVYVIYISKFDVFNRRRRLYHIERSFHDKGTSFSIHDGEHLIYVNASKEVDAEAEDDDVAELMEFFKNSQGQNDKFRRLTNRVHDLKNNESEVNTMCKLVADFAKEYAKEMIFDLVRKGALSAENGAEQLELSVEDFRNLLNETEQDISTPA